MVKAMATGCPVRSGTPDEVHTGVKEKLVSEIRLTVRTNLPALICREPYWGEPILSGEMVMVPSPGLSNEAPAWKSFSILDSAIPVLPPSVHVTSGAVLFPLPPNQV